jgi:hypothetical protein
MGALPPERSNCFVEMKRKTILLLGVGLSLAFFVMGCAGGAHHSVVPDYQAKTPRSIAALPVFNETVSLKGAEIFQPLLQKKLSEKGYESPAISYVDERLKEKEIREAGQVNSLTPQELGKLLGVDAVLYSAVTDFSTTYLLAYASMTVGGRFWLVDTQSGEKLWESDHQVKETKLGLDSKSIQDTISFATMQSYHPFVEKVVAESFLTLPNGPKYTPPASGAGCLMP